MSNILELIKVPTKIIIDETKKKKVDDETQKLIDMGIIEAETEDEDLKMEEVYYYFDPSQGIHEIRETYIPYKEEFKKVVIVTFSEGYIQTPPLFITTDELINLIIERTQ